MPQQQKAVSSPHKITAASNSTWLIVLVRYRLRRGLLRMSAALLMILSAGIALRTSSLDLQSTPNSLPMYLLLAAIVALVVDALVFKWVIKP